MKLLILYFSPTGITEKIAKVIGTTFLKLGSQVSMHDITTQANRIEKIDLRPFSAVVFGIPIHAWRAPRAVKEWIKTLNGQGKKCSTFYTYGGFGVHPTHYSTGQLLENQNFTIVSSAEFIGFYSFKRTGQRSREDITDDSYFDDAKDFARKTFKRFTGEDKAILEKTNFTEEQLESLEAAKFSVITQLPTRGGESCSMCMLCEEMCPTEAIKAKTGEADREKCIACLECVNNCPDNALLINDISDGWSFKVEMEKFTGESMKKLKSKIYL